MEGISVHYTGQRGIRLMCRVLWGTQERGTGGKGVTVLAQDGSRWAFDTEELAHLCMYEMGQQDYVVLYE